jgi:hypothetical protein
VTAEAQPPAFFLWGGEDEEGRHEFAMWPGLLHVMYTTCIDFSHQVWWLVRFGREMQRWFDDGSFCCEMCVDSIGGSRPLTRLRPRLAAATSE